MRRFHQIFVVISLLIGLAACEPVPVREAPPPIEAKKAADFEEVVSRLAPVVEDTCIQAGLVRNCRIRLYVAEVEDGTSNAFQSVDRLGRPFVLVTRPLLDEARNKDEMALVLAHEAAHHILNHLARQRVDAVQGAAVLAQAAERKGGTRQDVKEARRVGALVGRQLFSQEYELEADALGAIMLREAGFDAINGAQFFYRIPDPGNHALNTHPSNATRRAVVREAVLNNRLPGETLALLEPGA